MELRFFPINIFRETPKVTFFDAGIVGSNGSDVVIHSGEAISPPNKLKDPDYFKKVDFLEKTLNKECIDYPNQEDCLVCCN